MFDGFRGGLNDDSGTPQWGPPFVVDDGGESGGIVLWGGEGNYTVVVGELVRIWK